MSARFKSGFILSGKLLILIFGGLFLPTAIKAQTNYEQKAQQLVTKINNGDKDGATAYDAACNFALAGKSDEAFNYLDQAIERGFANPEKFKSDSDLNSLHNDPRWQSLLQKASLKFNEQLKFFWNRADFWESPAMKTPYQENLSETEKIAGLSKFWAEVKYNFANFDLVPNLDWDATYLEFLPKVKNTKTTLEYYKLLREMCARLKDGHTNIAPMPQFYDELSARPQLQTHLIEDKVIVTSVDTALQQESIKIGQEVIEINGLPVKEYAAQKVLPYISSSTKQDLDLRVYDYFLFYGAAQEPIDLTLRDEQGRIFKRTVMRLSREQRIAFNKTLPKATAPEAPFEMKMFPGNIAYVNLKTFADEKTGQMFADAFDEIAKSKALIIDLRENAGGDDVIGCRILSFLTDQPFKGTMYYTRQYRAAFRAWGRAQDPYTKDGETYAPNGRKFYANPIIVLTSPVTGSAAEDFLVSFVMIKRGMLIGEPTAGSTGQPLFITLPGLAGAVICSKRDKFPDGTDFVGKGVQPNKIIQPTIADFRAKRDTVLETAFREIRSKL